jgi:hypothetical protein
VLSTKETSIIKMLQGVEGKVKAIGAIVISQARKGRKK